MRSLEEEFAAFIGRVKHLDHETLAVQRDELRKERALLDQARLAVPTGGRREALDRLSQDAFAVMERRIYALENPTVIGPDHLREPPDRRRER
ncbi:hypothetical protein [Nocardia sp. NPDC004860]|uniref:hypothetical protein n=1 Tax=Nocardia sp. NPDC004860 TaxID=3154557 RepID=UPI0033AC4900